jgi:hypothetical protein
MPSCRKEALISESEGRPFSAPCVWLVNLTFIDPAAVPTMSLVVEVDTAGNFGYCEHASKSMAFCTCMIEQLASLCSLPPAVRERTGDCKLNANAICLSQARRKYTPLHLLGQCRSLSIMHNEPVRHPIHSTGVECAQLRIADSRHVPGCCHPQHCLSVAAPLVRSFKRCIL